MVRLCFSALLILGIVSSALSLPKNHKLNQKTAQITGIDSGEVSSRGVPQFGAMIYCGTGRNPLDYDGYGCFCGIGGEGKPLDDLDRCCKIHDACYGLVQQSGNCPFSASVYAIPYSRRGCTGCEAPDYYWVYGQCRHDLCMCDADAVECFKRSHFNELYKDYEKEKCV